MGHYIRIWSIALKQSVEIFLEDIEIDIFIEVPMADFSVAFFKRLSPLGVVDELHSNLMDILTIYSDEGQEQSFWF